LTVHSIPLDKLMWDPQSTLQAERAWLVFAAGLNRHRFSTGDATAGVTLPVLNPAIWMQQSNDQILTCIAVDPRLCSLPGCSSEYHGESHTQDGRHQPGC
jgi:hypothetical protein